uniref:Uncharacterized protein n=1 Tax=Candidatus Kentrum eta TaxID=2126337 RepID=A0A450UL02_9GAMM|nr:MAG: hypothetical protein BECKH772A_GA0070896_1004013 [Candidatus Kentron sp. H]VFJ93150.1 MAG: hypothetical protein BECKH772B_GA0070898_1003913 [Candidatus Kentron sp. H]VFK00005.1 MAG: hypothetical protein BECKH772C_GA0070978_1003813 [Candidatus Kentron sp. H]
MHPASSIAIALYCADQIVFRPISLLLSILTVILCLTSPLRALSGQEIRGANRNRGRSHPNPDGSGRNRLRWGVFPEINPVKGERIGLIEAGTDAMGGRSGPIGKESDPIGSGSGRIGDE